MAVKFREHITSNGLLMYCGKSSSNNDAVIQLADPSDIVCHTVAKGSPFVVIKGRADLEDIHEAASYCSVYSQDWKKNNRDVLVHYFSGRDIYKDKNMKSGTHGVRKSKELLVRKEDIEKMKKSLEIKDHFLKLLDKMKRIGLKKGEYAIFGSGPLAIRGLREA